MQTKQYHDYIIYEDGSIYSIVRGRFMKTTKNQYWVCHLRINGVSRSYYVHRILAICFIPNPDNKSQINHKNGIKTDNRLENLEWVTPSENGKHSYAVLGQTRKGPSKVVLSESGKVYRSVKEASIDTGYDYKYLINMLCGNCKNLTTLYYE